MANIKRKYIWKNIKLRTKSSIHTGFVVYCTLTLLVLDVKLRLDLVFGFWFSLKTIHKSN